LADPLERRPTDVCFLSAGKFSILIPDMGSDHCAGIVTRTLTRLSGVEDVRIALSGHRATVRFDRSAIQPGDMVEAVKRAGYTVSGWSEEGPSSDALEETERRYIEDSVRRVWIAAVPATLIMLLMAVHMF
jgi:P-type Cu+ transporter